MDPSEAFGPWVKRRRRSLALTQEELAQRLAYSIVTVRKVESGDLRPSRGLAEKLAGALEIPPAERDSFLAFARNENGHSPPILPKPAAEIPARAEERPPPAARVMPAIPNNLPAQPTSLVGREEEVARLRDLLLVTRLLTLTGSGGTGKTRLSLQVASEVMHSFRDGVWFVELAPVNDPSLVVNAVADVVGLQEEQGRPLLSTLLEFFENRELLLILDNCEHMLEACSRLAADILSAGRAVRILTSSREPLGVPGELAWRVPSLETPDPQFNLPLEQVQRFPAVRLFVERAAFAHPTFTLDGRTAPAVVRICCRLDGIPLAIELAAARLRALSVEQIAARLDNCFRLLSGGGSSTLPRQQTLRAAIDWSYDLLTEPERTLLRRLAVFAGGCTLEAAEQVCAGADIEAEDVLDLVGRLVDKSLAGVDEAAPAWRYRLLDTVRQYAREKLDAAGETSAVRDRHLVLYRAMAEQLEAELQGPNQRSAQEALEADADNFREALGWGLAQSSSPPDAPTRLVDGLRLAAALAEFWQRADRFDEGRIWLEKAVMLASGTPPGFQPRVLSGAGSMAWLQGDYQRAGWLHSQSLALAHAAGDRAMEAFGQTNLGTVLCCEGQLDEGEARYKFALAVYRELGDERGIANVLNGQTFHAGLSGDYAAARRLGEEALHCARRLNDDYMLASALHNLGDVARLQEDSEAARVLLEESIMLCRAHKNRRLLMMSLTALGRMALAKGDPGGAARYFRQGVTLSREMGEKRWLAELVEGLGELAVAQGAWSVAARLLAAATTFMEAIHSTMWSPDLPGYETAVVAVREALSPGQFAAEWAVGSAMTTERVIKLAMGEM